MRTNGKKFRIQIASGLGMTEQREIEILAGLIGSLRHGECINFNQEPGVKEFTLVARNTQHPDGDWMVSFRPYNDDPSRRRYYTTAFNAARAIYNGHH